jgi:CRISPR/Cas system type I-B associated protein Csh2 (Cas7 group RAMP superfamily)
MALWDTVKKGAEEGLEALKEGITVFVAEAERQSKIFRKKMELSSVQNSVRLTFTRLGSLVYDLYSKGEKDLTQNLDVKGMIDQIEGFKAKVREIEQEIESIRKEDAAGLPPEAGPKASSDA